MSASENEQPQDAEPTEATSEPTPEPAGGPEDAEMKTSPFPDQPMDEINLSDDYPRRNPNDE